jgi:hypothetical protein
MDKTKFWIEGLFTLAIRGEPALLVPDGFSSHERGLSKQQKSAQRCCPGRRMTKIVRYRLEVERQKNVVVLCSALERSLMDIRGIC